MLGQPPGQEIGEPGTQLTLRTFHTGGDVRGSTRSTTGLPRVEELFEALKMPKCEALVPAYSGGTGAMHTPSKQENNRFYLC